MAEILPESFPVVKETAKDWQKRRTYRKTNAHDMVMATTKDFVEIKDGNAFWKNKWDAAGKKWFGTWFTTTLNLLECSSSQW